jgi:hypothetical protein
MLKLFRDYVFHQLTPNGNPWIDLSHIVQCLNKVSSVLNKENFVLNLKMNISTSLMPVQVTKFVLSHLMAKM